MSSPQEHTIAVAPFDDSEFAAFLEQYRSGLFAVALDRTGSFDLAEDIAQQALAQAWEHRSELRSLEAVSGWLFRIAINCCLQWQRREVGRWAPLEAASEQPAPGAMLDELIKRDTVRQIRKALADVPIGNRIALLMSLAGHSYEEIAGFLNVPVGTVRGRIARARERLRRDLAKRLGIELMQKSLRDRGQ